MQSTKTINQKKRRIALSKVKIKTRKKIWYIVSDKKWIIIEHSKSIIFLKIK